MINSEQHVTYKNNKLKHMKNRIEIYNNEKQIINKANSFKLSANFWFIKKKQY